MLSEKKNYQWNGNKQACKSVNTANDVSVLAHLMCTSETQPTTAPTFSKDIYFNSEWDDFDFERKAKM